MLNHSFILLNLLHGIITERSSLPVMNAVCIFEIYLNNRFKKIQKS